MEEVLRSLQGVVRIRNTSALSDLILSANLADVELETGSIPADRILKGNPHIRSKVLGRSHDLLAHIVIWECGAVSYRWHYDQDEAYLVLSGEGFVNDEKGVERRLGPGDIAFFPAGTDATWRHPDHFRKIAILKESVWRPLGFGLKLWNKLFRMIGITDTSPLLHAVPLGRRTNSKEPTNQLS
ncbi:MAG: cupin domain-containing protein [Candidatus Acidiferrales bacterium]